MTRYEFIKFVADIAVKDWRERRIMLPSVVIAQACKESAFGTSELAVNANALFGIKKNGWTGETYTKKADEQNADGTMRTDENVLWRKYDSWEQSIIDHSTYIAERKVGNQKEPNFKAVIGETDVRRVIAGLVGDKNRTETAERCTDELLKHYVEIGTTAYGYMTGLNYPQSLLDDYIVKYGLMLYDTIEESEQTVSKTIVAIDAGHGSGTAGKRTPDGYREHYANVKVAGFFAEALTRCGIGYIKVGWNDLNSLDDADTPLATRQKLIKNAGVKYSVSFHFNAYGDGKSYNSAQGIETLIHNTYPADSRTLANKVQAQLVKGTKQKDRGVKTKALSMCNCNTMKSQASILIECGFMTNEYEAKLMKSDAFCKECAEETAKGLCEYLGVKYVSVESETVQTVAPEVKTLYRVQCGAFKSKANAEALRDKLKRDGYEAVVVSGS